MSISVSIVVPALNEGKNLSDTISAIIEANKSFNYILDILIVNDGSKDSTGEIADKIAKSHANVTVLHNKDRRGIGTAFITGMILAKGDYFGYIPGDHQITREYITSLFEKAGESDLILSYPDNLHVRFKSRQILSRMYGSIYRVLFGLNLKYFNGPALFRLKLLKELDLPTRFFSYHAETVTRFIKLGHSYIEVPCTLRERQHGKSTALQWHNLVGTGIGIIMVFLDIYWLKRSRYKNVK